LQCGSATGSIHFPKFHPSRSWAAVAVWGSFGIVSIIPNIINKFSLQMFHPDGVMEFNDYCFLQMFHPSRVMEFFNFHFRQMFHPDGVMKLYDFEIVSWPHQGMPW
jgi:hypothetical protein